MLFIQYSRTVFLILCYTGMAMLTVLTFAGAMPKPIWLLDMITHFRPQYFVAQCILFACFLVIRQRRKISITAWVAITLLLAGMAYNVWEMAPYFYTAHEQYTSPNKTIKILHMNVLGTNHNFDAAAKLIRQELPDILTLVEYNPRWENVLTASGALRQFPYRYVVPYGNDGLYSKIPLQHVQTHWMKRGQDPTTSATIQFDGQSVTLWLVHPRPPAHSGWYQRQLKHFQYWEQHQPPGNWLMIGDLNTSPWAYPFKHLTKKTGLRDSRLGFGLLPSWRLSKLPIYVPIDYVLISKNFAVHGCQLKESIGSDHLPLAVMLTIKNK